MDGSGQSAIGELEMDETTVILVRFFEESTFKAEDKFKIKILVLFFNLLVFNFLKPSAVIVPNPTSGSQTFKHLGHWQIILALNPSAQSLKVRTQSRDAVPTTA